MISDRHVDIPVRERPEVVGISERRLELQVHVDRGVARSFEKGRWHQRLVFPLAVPQIEVTDLGHVARQQSEAVAASRDALRVFPPVPGGDPERTEQPGLGVILSTHSRQLGEDRRQKLGIAAVVVEDIPGRIRHRTIEDEFGPVRAAFHFEKSDRPSVCRFAPIDSRRHVQQVLHRDRLLAIIDVGEIAVGKEVEHRMVRAVEQPVLQRHRRQGADDGLGGRIDDVRNVGAIRRVIRIEHDLAVTRDQQAVKAAAGPVRDQLGQISRIDALLFRRGCLPSPGRPDRPGVALRFVLIFFLGGSATHRSRQHDRAEYDPQTGNA